ncbi:MAG TPA: lytic transglycosylase domain-containing protein [Nocardioidaceae bacterium]|nr:lytic transglycosylase domain-containing protein [Nocardioidaceae bacterium]
MGLASVCLTVATVASGIVVGGQASRAAASASHSAVESGSTQQASAAAAEPAVADAVARRSSAVSRSDRRTSVDPVKKARLDQDQGGQVTATEDLTGRDPRTIARALLPGFGFDGSQFSCLDALYVSESGWDVHADNPTSSAYGIPQALPGEKMAAAGPDWEDDAATQIRWGLGYIKARYGTPCSAWSFKQGNNWY